MQNSPRSYETSRIRSPRALAVGADVAETAQAVFCRRHLFLRLSDISEFRPPRVMPAAQGDLTLDATNPAGLRRSLSQDAEREAKLGSRAGRCTRGQLAWFRM
jgi:hypothetical protein